MSRFGKTNGRRAHFKRMARANFLHDYFNNACNHIPSAVLTNLYRRYGTQREVQEYAKRWLEWYRHASQAVR